MRAINIPIDANVARCFLKPTESLWDYRSNVLDVRVWLNIRVIFVAVRTQNAVLVKVHILGFFNFTKIILRRSNNEFRLQTNFSQGGSIQTGDD